MALSVCMVVGVLCGTALAADESIPEGTRVISTEDELRNAFANGGNYKLADNITITTSADLRPSEGVSVEIDLNNKSIISTAAESVRLFGTDTIDKTVTAKQIIVQSGGKLILDNAVIASSDDSSIRDFIAVQADGTLEVNNAEFTLNDGQRSITMNDGALGYIKGGTFMGEDYAVVLRGKTLVVLRSEAALITPNMVCWLTKVR